MEIILRILCMGRSKKTPYGENCNPPREGDSGAPAWDSQGESHMARRPDIPHPRGCSRPVLGQTRRDHRTLGEHRAAKNIE